MKRILLIPKNWGYGYAYGVQYFTDALKKLGFSVVMGMPTDSMDPVDVIIDTEYPGFTPTESIEKWKEYAPVYLKTDFEAYPLPPEFFDALNKYDGVIVHSEYEKYLFRMSGATEEQLSKIVILHHPVTYDFKNLTKDSYRESLDIDKDNYVIGVIGSPTIRKGFAEDYLAYMNAFADNADEFAKKVTLLYRPSPYPQFVESGKQIFAMIKALKLQSKSPLPVKVISDANFDVIKFYNTINALLSLHHSEGYGLPLAEASVLGKQVIATAYSGNVDFMSTNTSYLVPAVPAYNIDPYFKYTPYQQWADPILPAAAELIRTAYEDFVKGTPKLNKEFYMEHYDRALMEIESFVKSNSPRKTKSTDKNVAKITDRLIEL